MSKLFIIKIGGNVLDNPPALSAFLQDFAAIREPKILIHGGGKIATKIGDSLGIESKYVNGRRITDAATLDVVTMVYGGLVNKHIVATLQKLGTNGIGLTGADGNTIRAVRRPVKDVDYGFVGDITPEGVNVNFLSTLLNAGIVPVFAPLTHAEGAILNTNADTIASVLAVALCKQFDVRLIFCFEKKGVLRNVNDPSTVIRHLPKSKYEELLPAGVFADGILPKLENAYAAIQTGVKEVLIGEASDLLKNTGSETEGTLITI
ncbi:acetylglutamate kinase [Parachryseolinea silvisoli]|jgi:acetylglutamate kinase|uniref:acetylglutamate kinase n=1 Tax=Parachryseolinea silvisoli TaxID=2873601 RepID=UPI002265F6C8|nr:acetylglutamate kinase [Parachryseolinea silvisoli]MCD9014519.1 acetylglutamate kinase [Parachryseolinea silvisoli]